MDPAELPGLLRASEGGGVEVTQKTIHPASSHVSEATWDELSNTLTVTFVSGDVYTYQDVTEDEFEHMKRAHSVGGFVASLRARHAYTRVG